MESHSQLVLSFQSKLNNIDKMADLATQSQDHYLLNKYRNIQATISILRSLIQKFNKKADNFQCKMKKTARIEDIFYQTNFHKKRIEQCETLSQKIIDTINKKKDEMNKYKKEADRLRSKMISLKIDNIKTIMKMQELQELKRVTLEKRIADQNRKLKKQKQIQQRQMIIQKNCDDRFQKTRAQKAQAQRALFNAIQAKVKARDFMESCYQCLKQKLLSNQKKSSQYGLMGSMLFKLKQDNSFQASMKKLKFNDQRLKIYDILKNKHSNFKKTQAKSQQKVEITKQQFMEFGPLQIAGVIELKGGLQKIKNKRVFLKGVSRSFSKDYVKMDSSQISQNIQSQQKQTNIQMNLLRA